MEGPGHTILFQTPLFLSRRKQSKIFWSTSTTLKFLVCFHLSTELLDFYPETGNFWYVFAYYPHLDALKRPWKRKPFSKKDSKVGRFENSWKGFIVKTLHF